MSMDENFRERGVATADFERELRALVLDAFARGAAVEGTWTITPRPGTVPDWTIEITRHATDATDDERVTGD